MLCIGYSSLEAVFFVFVENCPQPGRCATHSGTAVRAETAHLSEDRAITAHCRVAHPVVNRPFG